MKRTASNHRTRVRTFGVGVSVLLATALTLGLEATVRTSDAGAAMCVVNCFDQDGGWQGGGGLDGGNPNTGSGVGGSDGGRVGGDGYAGYDPDSTAPSGTGWDDPRLAPHDSDVLPPGTYAGVGGSGAASATTARVAPRMFAT